MRVRDQLSLMQTAGLLLFLGPNLLLNVRKALRLLICMLLLIVQDSSAVCQGNQSAECHAEIWTKMMWVVFKSVVLDHLLCWKRLCFTYMIFILLCLPEVASFTNSWSLNISSQESSYTNRQSVKFFLLFQIPSISKTRYPLSLFEW